MEKMWEYLDFIRIYTKPKGQIPDYDAPVIMPRTKNKMEDFDDGDSFKSMFTAFTMYFDNNLKG